MREVLILCHILSSLDVSHILLGYPWIKQYQATSSMSCHQGIRYVHTSKEVTIARDPYMPLF